MANLADIDRISNPEAVILASMYYEDTAKAIFSTPKDFNWFTQDKTGDEQVRLRLNRLTGRQIFSENGLVPLGMGTERLVLGNIATREVIKYAYKSSNPEGDLEAESFDYDACKKFFGSVAITSSLGVEKLQDQQVLVSRQPWLELVPLEKVIGNSKIDKQAEEVTEKACDLAESVEPLNLDGTSLMVMRGGGGIVIPDTSLVCNDRILVDEKIIKLPRPERSWRSLDLYGSAETQKVA